MRYPAHRNADVQLVLLAWVLTRDAASAVVALLAWPAFGTDSVLTLHALGFFEPPLYRILGFVYALFLRPLRKHEHLELSFVLHDFQIW